MHELTDKWKQVESPQNALNVEFINASIIMIVASERKIE
jgi:hypothetical protein